MGENELLSRSDEAVKSIDITLDDKEPEEQSQGQETQTEDTEQQLEEEREQAQEQEQEQEQEERQNTDLMGMLPTSGILTPEEFKKVTYVAMAKRGKLLSKIDEALKDYTEYVENTSDRQEDYEDSVSFVQSRIEALKKLTILYEACKEWLKAHSGDKYIISVKKRLPHIVKLQDSVGYEILRLRTTISSMGAHDEAVNIFEDESFKAFDRKGLVPYEEFEKAIDNVKLIGLIGISGKMKKRREEGKDRYLIHLLKMYKRYDDLRKDSGDMSKTVDKDTYKKVTKVKYSALLDLEKPAMIG